MVPPAAMALLMAQLHRIDEALSALTGSRNKYRSAGFIVFAGLCLCALSLCYAVYVRCIRGGGDRRTRRGNGSGSAGSGPVPIRVAVWPSVAARATQTAAVTLLEGLKDALASELGRDAVRMEVMAVCLSAASLVEATAISELAARCGLGTRLLLLDTLRDPPDGAWMSVVRVKVSEWCRVAQFLMRRAPGREGGCQASRWRHLHGRR